MNQNFITQLKIYSMSGTKPSFAELGIRFGLANCEKVLWRIRWQAKTAVLDMEGEMDETNYHH